MNVRPATIADVKEIGMIRVRAWQAAYREVMPAEYLSSLDPNENLQGLKSILQSASGPLVNNVQVINVTELNGATVGFSILGSPRDDAPANTLELWALNVHPEHWRKGIGKALLQASMVDARNREASTLQLWCIQTNWAARHLYERCGFIATGRQRISSALTGHVLHEVAYALALTP